MSRLAAIIVLVTFPAVAGAEWDNELYRFSQIALASTSALDAHSSWNKPELNPVLRSEDGRFRWRGIAIKAAVTGGVLSGSHFLKRRGEKKLAAVVNLTLSAAFIYLSVRNYRNFQPNRSLP